MFRITCSTAACVLSLTAGWAWSDQVPPPPPVPGINSPTPLPPIPETYQPQAVPVAPPPAAITTTPGYPGYAGETVPPLGTPLPGTPGAGPAAGIGPYWAPGGYEARTGSPYYYHSTPGGEYVVTGNPYYDHFGPGFQRHSLHGHYRFPYYTYRAPWYYPGRAVYNRDTNFPW